MKFTFDPAKDATNLTKHSVSLAFGARVFDQPHIMLSPIRPIDGELRYKAIGLAAGRLWTVIHVWRDGTVRLISVRRSNAGEQRSHDRDPG